ncbi:SDR family NAD(P)-dependent oxidoreductase [Thermomonospora catenispora]|uniref:SDR family NAD(P)-dependent oxidoreductase n=1 Tax=Thermomonospora catenispora TaxID=2493090 RepID=UPI00111E20D0|nr:SDR family oxidoreductase [Thermomonospora catenispora]TNY37178.1 SDR family oxidoreductase [Thermomonospora catenispora]
MPTALVTGATSGIGAGFARRLASDGFDLILVARDTDRLERTAADLHDRYGASCETLSADLSTDEGIAAAEKHAAGRVDLLINNAGFGQRGIYLNAPVADEVKMLRVHCEAVLRLTSAALPGMLERGRGGVINVASVAAFFSRGTYGASKAWAVSFSRAVMRDHGGRGVHVMALCPGFVRTEFHERAGMNVSGIPGFMWLDQDLVIDTALRDLRRGALVSVPGAQYKAIVALGRMVPGGLLDRIASRAGRRFD